MAGDGHGIDDRAEVLIVGGGIAGVEAALALRDLAGERVEVQLCDPRPEFVFRPFAVGEPYGAARVFRYDLDRLAERCGAVFRPDGIVAVVPEQRVALTRDGERLAYDYLIFTGGVRMLWAVPGAVTFWGVADEGQVGEIVADLRAGVLERLVFTMPGGRSWVLPLYELALLGTTELDKAGAGQTTLTIVTPEDTPLELFGRRAAEQMCALLTERGIEVLSGSHPVRFDHGRLRVSPGEAVEADAVITLPRLEGRRVSGIPHDADGFVSVDEHGRVIGLDSVFAAGDVTGFPVKQGDIATQQADAVAEAIAVDVGAAVEPRPFDPVSGLGAEPSCAGANRRIPGRYLAPFVTSLAEEAEIELSERARSGGARRLRLTRSA